MYLFQLSVMRPPNYTLLMIWLPVILLAFIVGYLKRENLHILYEPKYWAIAAMVCIYIGIVVPDTTHKCIILQLPSSDSWCMYAADLTLVMKHLGMMWIGG